MQRKYSYEKKWQERVRSVIQPSPLTHAQTNGPRFHFTKYQKKTKEEIEKARNNPCIKPSYQLLIKRSHSTKRKSSNLSEGTITNILGIQEKLIQVSKKEISKKLKEKQMTFRYHSNKFINEHLHQMQMIRALNQCNVYRYFDQSTFNYINLLQHSDDIKFLAEEKTAPYAKQAQRLQTQQISHELCQKENGDSSINIQSLNLMEKKKRVQTVCRQKRSKKEKILESSSKKEIKQEVQNQFGGWDVDSLQASQF